MNGQARGGSSYARWWGLLACATLIGLAACGSSSHAVDPPAARVGTAAISWADVQRYVDYSLRFYAWSHTLSRARRCPPGAQDRSCALVRQQALRRLIEEQLVLAYARRHAIALSAAQRQAIHVQLRSMARAHGSEPSLLSRLQVTRTFLRKLLEREALVQSVEEAVAPAWARAGPTLRVRKVALFFGGAADKQAAYRQAQTLATDGGPLPARALARVEWVAPFRLAPALLSALTAAQPGQYTGPFSHARSYLVVQLLARSVHPYGSPARLELEARYLHSWLRRQWQRTQPVCFDKSDTKVSCP